MVISPSPGQENTCSTITAPPKSVGICMPITVTMGSSALRRACLLITRKRPMPLARAVRR